MSCAPDKILRLDAEGERRARRHIADAEGRELGRIIQDRDLQDALEAWAALQPRDDA